MCNQCRTTTYPILIQQPHSLKAASSILSLLTTSKYMPWVTQPTLTTSTLEHNIIIGKIRSSKSERTESPLKVIITVTVRTVAYHLILQIDFNSLTLSLLGCGYLGTGLYADTFINTFVTGQIF